MGSSYVTKNKHPILLFEKQQYQQDCVDNIINALQNVDFQNQDYSYLTKNLTKDNYNFEINSDKKCLDILMETGTGKTFTYIQTIFEIHKKFKQTKFIIVVPRTAIKLGVVQNIKLTKEYFYNQYQRHLNYIDYPKDGNNKIKQDFLNSQDLSVLITTNHAFNGENNNINEIDEDLFTDGSIWKGIAKKNPIVIIDEPHLLKGDKTTQYLDKLDALTIRFGATYPKCSKKQQHNLSNVAYTLDSISAFNQYLVKKIRIHTLLQHSDQDDIHISNINSRKKIFTLVYSQNEQIKTSTVKLHDDLGSKTGIAKYLGVSVTKINAAKVFLSNQTILEPSTGNYELNDNEVEQMISTTIENHFKHEQIRFEQGIKTLSLFFIPNIQDFRASDLNPKPRIKTLFEKHYRQIRQKYYQASDNDDYKAYLDQDFNPSTGNLQVHQGYFSGDKGTKDHQEATGVNLILNDKEKLLSLQTPLRFIFSVWALQEGWDNPNVFNICKLSSTHKEASRRQQVGRGLRIAINNHGKRLTYNHFKQDDYKFYEINTLDVVVSGKEKDFIEQIQTEIQNASLSIVGNSISYDILIEKGLNDREASRLLNTLEDNSIIEFDDKQEQYLIKESIKYFIDHNRKQLNFLNDERYHIISQLFTEQNNSPRIEDGNKSTKKTITIKPELTKKFKHLWETINRKSTITYKSINQEEVINQIAITFNKNPLTPIENKLITKVYNSQNNTIETLQEKALHYNQESQPFFNQSHAYSQFILEFAKDNKQQLPLHFITKLFNQLGDTGKQSILNNPKQAQKNLSQIIKDTIHQTIIQHISYQFNPNTSIYPNELQNKAGIFYKEIDSGKLGRYCDFESYNQPKSPQHNLYDNIVGDSNIELEIQQQDPPIINNNHITVFAKLPKINIPTPYKTYNPDFAYLITDQQSNKQLFLIVESKGYNLDTDIPPDEKVKINYAKRFFEHMQQQFPEIKIAYKTRINRQELSELLANISH